MESDLVSLARRAAGGCQESARRMMGMETGQIIREMVGCADQVVLTTLASVLRRLSQTESTARALMEVASVSRWPRVVLRMLGSACASYFSTYMAKNRWEKSFVLERFYRSVVEFAACGSQQMRAIFLSELEGTCDGEPVVRMCVEGLLSNEYGEEYGEAVLRQCKWLKDDMVGEELLARVERGAASGEEWALKLLSPLMAGSDERKARVYKLIMRMAAVPELASLDMVRAVVRCRYYDGKDTAEWEWRAAALFDRVIEMPINIGFYLLNLANTTVMNPDSLRRYFVSRSAQWDSMTREEWMDECACLAGSLHKPEMMQVVMSAYSSGNPVVQRLALHALSNEWYGDTFWTKDETSMQLITQILTTMPKDDIAGLHFVCSNLKHMKAKNAWTVAVKQQLLGFLTFTLRTTTDSSSLHIIFDALRGITLEIDPRSCPFMQIPSLSGLRKRLFELAGRSLPPAQIIESVTACGTHISDLIGVATGFGSRRFDEMVRMMYPCLQALVAEMRTRRRVDIAKLVRTMSTLIDSSVLLSRETFLFVMFAYSVIASAHESSAPIDDPSGLATELIIAKIHIRNMRIVPDVMFEHYRDPLLEASNRATHFFYSLIDPVDRRRKTLLARAMFHVDLLKSSPSTENLSSSIESLRLLSKTTFKNTQDVKFIDSSISFISSTFKELSLIEELQTIASDALLNWIELLRDSSHKFKKNDFGVTLDMFSTHLFTILQETFPQYIELDVDHSRPDFGAIISSIIHSDGTDDDDE
jgi:hypothetical protein